MIGVSGASGVRLALRLLELLASQPDCEIHCVISPGALKVIECEARDFDNFSSKLPVNFWDSENFAAPPASGTWWHSGPNDAMVVVPCSTGTLGAVANGYCANLLHRACEVALKEKRKLILVTRETPLSRIQVVNMLSLIDAGAIIMPFSPGLYFQPQSIGEMLDQFCFRIMDELDLKHEGKVWEG